MKTPNNHAELTTAAENAIVAFHIGRGGHFNNPGHVAYLGQHGIGHYTDDLFCDYDLSEVVSRLEKQHEDWDTEDTSYDDKIIMTKKDVFHSLVNDENFDELEKRFNVKEEELGEKYYSDGAGNNTGLTEKECETGIGRINEDGHYDTTYAQKLSDCSEGELRLIYNSNEFGYMSALLTDYIIWMLADEVEA